MTGGLACRGEGAVLRALEALQPIRTPVLNCLFNDLECVLGPDYVPDEEEIQDLTLRMRGHLMQLLATVPEHSSRPEAIAEPVATVRGLLDVEVPGDYTGIRIHLRHMAVAGLALLGIAGATAPSS
ncbi:DUF6415 family natural product biosynthesis protein [Streptomyces sp. NPDC048723]|uniref:DUF6415 family natural product biosynthesis protein n=1 Tax=Streptomyces sp. NPDC048723 TaxID=3365589 RepID=UPI003714CF63